MVDVFLLDLESSTAFSLRRRRIRDRGVRGYYQGVVVVLRRRLPIASGTLHFNSVVILLCGVYMSLSPMFLAQILVGTR